MPEGVNSNGERIGGVYVEVAAVGAEKTAQQVNNVAGAVASAGKQAEAANPKLNRLRGAFQNAAIQAVGLAGGLGQVGSALVSLLPGWGAIAAAAASAALAFRGFLNESSNLKAAEIAKELDGIAASFKRITDSFDDNRSSFEKAFESLNQTAEAKIAELNALLDKSETSNFFTDLFSWNGPETSQRTLEAMTYTQRIQLELGRSIDALLAKQREKRIREEKAASEKIADNEFKTWMDSVNKFWDAADKAANDYFETERKFLEFVAKDKLRIAKEHTEELKKQKDLVNDIISAQTNFARQFNSSLNIEQLQSIDSTITRIENAINRLAR